MGKHIYTLFIFVISQQIIINALHDLLYFNFYRQGRRPGDPGAPGTPGGNAGHFVGIGDSFVNEEQLIVSGNGI